MYSISRNLFLLAAAKRLPEFQKDFALRLSAFLSGSDQRDLYSFHEDICAKKVSIVVTESLIKAELIDDEKYEVTLPDNLTETIGICEIKNILRLIADCYCDILPLGSVVDLKKEFLKMVFDEDKIENIRLIITQRFAYEDGMDSYFTYGAVAYPFGALIAKRVLYFTPPLIEHVVYRGYSDQQEETFVGIVKNELIVNRGLLSAGFSTSSEFFTAMRGEKL